MGCKILVTGGAGFIGSHLVDTLLEEGHRVRVFDNLDPQVHGQERKIPTYLNKEAEFIRGDMCHRDEVKKALDEIEIIFHLAAVVGVAQSMYEIEKYIQVNTLGTAILWELLINEPNQVRKVIVASSMSCYGEGKYKCIHCGVINNPNIRHIEQLRQRVWEIKCPNCNGILKPIPTDEEKSLLPTSIYAISKKDQEEISLVMGRAYNIPTIALRYFNVYGQRQALSNPYTGVAAIFSSRILNNHPPLIFEDGLQSRDFVHVKDIVRANLLAMKSEKGNYKVFNIGTGKSTTVLDMAKMLIQRLNPNLNLEIVGKFREGDIRHCYADISQAEKFLGFVPSVMIEDGIQELIDWVSQQEAIDLVEKATSELESKGLTK